MFGLAPWHIYVSTQTLYSLWYPLNPNVPTDLMLMIQISYALGVSPAWIILFTIITLTFSMFSPTYKIHLLLVPEMQLSKTFLAGVTHFILSENISHINDDQPVCLKSVYKTYSDLTVSITEYVSTSSYPTWIRVIHASLRASDFEFSKKMENFQPQRNLQCPKSKIKPSFLSKLQLAAVIPGVDQAVEVDRKL